MYARLISALPGTTDMPTCSLYVSLSLQVIGLENDSSNYGDSSGPTIASTHTLPPEDKEASCNDIIYV